MIKVLFSEDIIVTSEKLGYSFLRNNFKLHHFIFHIQYFY